MGKRPYRASHCQFTMPLIKIETTVAPTEEQRAKLVTTLSRIGAATIAKPEQYVMVTLSTAEILMSGAAGPAAFVDVRSIGGLSPDVTRALSREVCALLTETLGIPGQRVYLTFTELGAAMWGWNGSTFG